MPAASQPPPTSRLRLLELYCGIGGCTAAVAAQATVVGAFDINTVALSVYRLNHPHPARARTLDTLARSELAGLRADLWWLSPPCQPFTRRGLGRDDRDPRSTSLLALLRQVQALRPRYLALENVPGFAGSRTHRRLRAVLDGAGYGVAEAHLCPSELGVPNRRRRFYLLAAREAPPPTLPPRGGRRRPLAELLDPDDDPALTLDPALAARYAHALHVVSRHDPEAVTACFTAAYGRSPVRSGSYLRLADGGLRLADSGLHPTEGGLRRFAPREILRLLGFPADWRLPPEIDRAAAWRLVGNSLSLPAVRWLLSALPELRELRAGDGAPAATLPAD